MSIPQAQFDQACRRFENHWRFLEDKATHWTNVQLLESYGTKYLRITASSACSTKPDTVQYDNWDSDEKEHSEHDDGALVRTSAQHETDHRLIAVYDIIHSSSYQVPVLYIIFNAVSTKAAKLPVLPGPNKAYELLVPASYRPQINSIGVVGALSMTEHPISGLPAYFIHPCLTAEAMDSVQEHKCARDPEGYLMLWLGLVGPGVGLEVPVELAEAMTSGK